MNDFFNKNRKFLIFLFVFLILIISVFFVFKKIKENIFDQKNNIVEKEKTEETEFDKNKLKSGEELSEDFSNTEREIKFKSMKIKIANSYFNNKEGFLTAINLIEVKEYEKSIELLNEIKDKNISNEEKAWAYRLIGRNYHDRDMYIKAIENYDISISLNPKDSDVWYNKGIMLNSLGSFSEALKAYDESIRIDDENSVKDTDTYNNKGITLTNLGRYEEAFEMFDKVLNIDPNETHSLVNKGILYAILGDFNRALYFYDKVINLNPNISEVYANKGNVFLMVGKNEEAKNMFDKALEINSNNNTALYNRGLSFLKMWKFGEALGEFEKALKINPNDVEALHGKGEALIGLRKNEEAIDVYDRAIELDPSLSDSYIGKAAALSNLGRKDEANKLYANSTNVIVGKDAIDFNSIGSDFLNAYRYDEAIKMYEKAIEIDPNYAWAYYNKGLALEEQKKYNEALEMYNKAMNISPFYNVYNAKCSVLGKIGRYEEAIKFCDQAIKINPNVINAYQNAGFIFYYKIGDKEKGNEYFEKSNKILGVEVENK